MCILAAENLTALDVCKYSMMINKLHLTLKLIVSETNKYSVHCN